MARILCDNTGAAALQPLVFQMAAQFNPVQSCNDRTAIPRPSLAPWRQTRPG